jgi:hypothetical protein
MSSTAKSSNFKSVFKLPNNYCVPKKELPSHSSIKKEDQLELLVKLSRLNLTHVEEYLKHESAQIREFINGFKMYEEYYV